MRIVILIISILLFGCISEARTVQLPRLKKEQFTASGSWTSPKWVSEVLIIMCGGGGGGAGGAGGGGGGQSEMFSVSVTPNTSYSFTVGVGGAGGGVASPGSAGGETNITISGSTYRALGGRRGENSSASVIQEDSSRGGISNTAGETLGQAGGAAGGASGAGGGGGGSRLGVGGNGTISGPGGGGGLCAGGGGAGGGGGATNGGAGGGGVIQFIYAARN